VYVSPARTTAACNAEIHECVEFHRLTDDLDKVVATCERAGDPRGMCMWYRDKLLHDDRGVQLRERVA